MAPLGGHEAHYKIGCGHRMVLDATYATYTDKTREEVMPLGFEAKDWYATKSSVYEIDLAQEAWRAGITFQPSLKIQHLK